MEGRRDERAGNRYVKKKNSRDGIDCNVDLSKIDKILVEVAKERGLTEPSFHLSKGSKDGDNYMGIVYRTEILGKRKDGRTGNLRCFLKCAPIDKYRREVLHARRMFLREVYFYEDVLPVFQDFNDQSMASSVYAPLLYGYNKTMEEEVLVLEDLSCNGFQMKGSKLLDYSHVSLALRRLGEFHAYSFATRVKKPNEFEKFKRMEEPLFGLKKPSESALQTRSRFLVEIAVKSLRDEDKRYTEKLRNFVENFYQHMMDATNGNAAEPYSVVNHGDAWTNNMLFKYGKDTDGSSVPLPLEHRFIDFQLCRYASPALDIVYMLFCCCTQELRSQYFDRLLCEYYRSLSECLQRLGCDSATLFPFDALTEQLERFGKFAAGMAIFVLHIFTDEKNEVTEIKEDMDLAALERRIEEDHFYRNRLRDTLKDLIDRGYL